MKYVSFLFALLTFSCTKKPSTENYQGRLDELIVGDFVLEKDLETQYIHDLQVIVERGFEMVYYKTPNPTKKASIYKFHEVLSGKLSHQIAIPWEGPEALKGIPTAMLPEEKNSVIALSKIGDVGRYDTFGKKVWGSQMDFHLSSHSSDYVQFSSANGIMALQNGWLQVGQDPSNLHKNFDPKARLMSSEFPLEFTNWLTWINLETGEVKHSDFLAPKGYEDFKHDITATVLHGAYDSKRDFYYLSFPYSDSLYQLQDHKLIRTLKPNSNIQFNYLPSEVIPWGQNNTVWALPKEASKHVFLLYDRHHDLLVRVSKINESGAGETRFQRTKHYVLSIYSGEWEPKGEYFFDYEGELDLENWFLASQGLFLSKPEQPNEDEYEFYRVDLSRFGGK